MNRRFYDVESLDNLFSVAVWRPDDKPARLDVYVLADDEQMRAQLFSPTCAGYNALKERICERNPSLADTPGWQLCLYDLTDATDVCNLISMLGVPPTVLVRTKDKNDKLRRNPLTCDRVDVRDACARTRATSNAFSPDVADETQPVVMGYNSYNYDLTILARYVADVLALDDVNDNNVKCGVLTLTCDCSRASAHYLREFNDCLFSARFKSCMPQALCYDAGLLIAGNNDGKLAGELGIPRPGASLPPWARSKTPPDKLDLKRDRNWYLSANHLRLAWLKSGLHIDVARLNEKAAHVGLKRQLAVIGRQILESDRLSGATKLPADMDAYLELLAYNVSDVVNLRYLADDPNYAAPAQNKRMICSEYPECVLIDTGGAKRMSEVGQNLLTWTNIRPDRLRADSSSQQVISTTLCPDRKNPLMDAKELSFVYPDEVVADELRTQGIRIESRDVLEETKEFFERDILPRIADEHKERAASQFDRMYRHYKWMRHNSFNSSAAYEEAYNSGSTVAPGVSTNMLYFGVDGCPTSAYITFSEGGLHGAEYNLELYLADERDYDLASRMLGIAKQAFAGDAKAMVDCVRAQGRSMASGRVTHDMAGREIKWPAGHAPKLSDLLRSGFSASNASKCKWKEFTAPELFCDVKTSSEQDQLLRDIGFPDDIRSDKLNPRYVYTTAAEVNHEDFKSYYPNLLRMMRAFYNPALGYDRYGQIYGQKEEFGRYMSDKSLTDEERAYWKIRRNGVKLMLNAGSGAGDAKFDNPIRMNNRVLAMRLIGQMFTWRIGQAQSIQGARVVSTNTDGLYTVMDEDANNRILAREAAVIGVDIEPERMKLISKDANNRVEYTVSDGPDTGDDAHDLIGRFHILSAGGSLAYHAGPAPNAAISRPAFFDWLTCYYLMNVEHAWGQDGFARSFDSGLARRIAEQLLNMDTDEGVVLSLLMFQHIVASAPSSISYVCARDVDADGCVSGHRVLQHYNRVFYVTADACRDMRVAPVVLDRVVGRKVAYATGNSRVKKGEARYRHDDEAVRALIEAGHYADGTDALRRLEADGREAAFTLVPGVAPGQLAYVCNEDIRAMDPARARALLASVDIDAYVSRVGEIYEGNWRNMPATEPAYRKLADVARHGHGEVSDG